MRVGKILIFVSAGLDSFTASEVMEVVKGLVSSGITIAATIHTPTSRTFQLFDRVLILQRGRIVYFGDNGEAATNYFSSSPYFEVLCPAVLCCSSSKFAVLGCAVLSCPGSVVLTCVVLCCPISGCACIMLCYSTTCHLMVCCLADSMLSCAVLRHVTGTVPACSGPPPALPCHLNIHLMLLYIALAFVHAGETCKGC